MRAIGNFKTYSDWHYHSKYYFFLFKVKTIAFLFIRIRTQLHAYNVMIPVFPMVIYICTAMQSYIFILYELINRGFVYKAICQRTSVRFEMACIHKCGVTIIAFVITTISLITLRVPAFPF